MPMHFQHTLFGLKPIDVCLLVAHFRHKLGNLSITIIYAPTEVAEDHTKDEFYNKLKCVPNSLSPNDLSLVLTDMNATDSSSVHDLNMVPHITGMVFADPVTNDSRECLLFLCHCTGYCFTNNYFSNNSVHQWMWYSHDGCTRKAIDHILVLQHW